MAGSASRDLLIKKGAASLLGINAKSIAVAKEPIDVTTDEDNGYRLLLDVAGTKTLDISFSGVTKDDAMRGIIMTEGGQLLTDIEVSFPITGSQTTTGDTITGNFFFNGWTENGGGSDGAIEFDGTLQSSGVWTFTAGS
jgi:predicted secreted protein